MTDPRIDSARASQQVVVGVDGSPASLRALQWAADYATARHMHVEVVVAVDSSFPQGSDPHTSAEQMLDRLIGQQRAESRRLSIDGRVVQGDPAKVLESASEGAALLVVAQRGHGQLVGLLLGSVSEHCITHAKCPVLVYREAPRDAGPGGTGAPPATAGARRDLAHQSAQSDSPPWERLDQLMRDPGGI
jgi:nucleotide-binding universal stress UspA family protein